MKAVLWTKYGPPEVLQLAEVEPPDPAEKEILIRVQATSVTAGDCEMRSLKFPLYLALPMRLFTGLFKPTRITILGMELAGEVAAVGSQVKRFKAGDRVFGSAGFNLGTYAEYVCLPEEPGDMDGPLAEIPANIPFEQAAVVATGGLEALHYLNISNLQPGEKILINGAGGSIGTFGLQLARNHFGAEVTAVDSASKLDMLRSLGAAHVIDYEKEDFTRSGRTYDVIFDVVGKSPFSGSLRALNPNGRYLIANPNLPKMLGAAFVPKKDGRIVIVGANANYSVASLIFLKELLENGTIKPVIDRSYPLEQIVEAHHYVESGQKKGSLVITVAHDH